MIDITRDNTVDENEPQALSATSDEWEGLEVTPEESSTWEPRADSEDSVLGTGPESEPFPRDPLEWYLMKLLAPVEDAPRERAFQPADEAPEDEIPAPQELETPAPPEPPEVAEKPQETRPRWQTMAADVPPAPVAAAAASPAAEPVPADAPEMAAPRKRQASKPKKRATMRSLTKGERTGGGRQKLMTALIPILAIAMVVILKHSPGARPSAKAAGAAPASTARPLSTDVQIAWEIPSPYDLTGRDPMKGTPPPAVVVVENNGTAAAATEPPVELLVTGILYSLDNPAAIVDTQVVHEGQQISGATVEKIEKDGIQFERNGRRWKQAVTQP